MDCPTSSLFSIPNGVNEYEIERPAIRSHLDKLPLELIYLIIDHLALQATNQAGYFTDVKSLAIVWFSRDVQAQAYEIQHFVHQTLFFSKIAACNRNLIAPKGLEIHTFSHLLHFLEIVNKQLYSLNLNQFGLQIDDRALAQIVELCPNLEELNLGSASLTAAGIDSLLKLRKLHTLALYALKLEGNDFDKLAQLQLKELHITGAPQLLDSHIEAFSKRAIKKVSLTNCSKLTQESFSSLAKMPLHSLVFMQKSCAIPNKSHDSKWLVGIHHLDLSHTKLTKESMAMIAKCENLQTLILDDCTDLTDSMLAVLVALPLKKLSVSKCKKLTNNALHCIGKMVHLTELILTYCQHITDKGMKELAPLQLKAVDIGWCFHLSNETIQFLDRESMTEVKATECPLVELGSLQLNHLEITDSEYKIFKRAEMG